MIKLKDIKEVEFKEDVEKAMWYLKKYLELEGRNK